MGHGNLTDKVGFKLRAGICAWSALDQKLFSGFGLGLTTEGDEGRGLQIRSLGLSLKKEKWM